VRQALVVESDDPAPDGVSAACLAAEDHVERGQLTTRGPLVGHGLERPLEVAGVVGVADHVEIGTPDPQLRFPQRRRLPRHLRSRTGIDGVKMGLLRERVPPADFDDSARIAAAIKALPLKLLSARPLAEAISSAGGVAFESLDERLMARSAPGVFCAGEMLDWEAPTGGYLLTACFASGRAAGLGALRWLQGAGSRKPA